MRPAAYEAESASGKLSAVATSAKRVPPHCCVADGVVGPPVQPPTPAVLVLTPERPYFSCWRMRAVATRSLPPERSARRRKNSTTRLTSFTLSFGPEKLPIPVNVFVDVVVVFTAPAPAGPIGGLTPPTAGSVVLAKAPPSASPVPS